MAKSTCPADMTDLVVGRVTVRYRAGFEARMPDAPLAEQDSRYLKIVYIGEDFSGFYGASLERLTAASPAFLALDQQIKETAALLAENKRVLAALHEDARLADQAAKERRARWAREDAEFNARCAEGRAAIERI